MRSLFFFVFTIPYHTSTYCLCAQHIPVQPDIFCNQRKYVRAGVSNNGSCNLIFVKVYEIYRIPLSKEIRKNRKFREFFQNFNICYVHLCDVITNGRLMYMTPSSFTIKSITQLCSIYKGYVMTFTALEIQDLK